MYLEKICYFKDFKKKKKIGRILFWIFKKKYVYIFFESYKDINISFEEIWYIKKKKNNVYIIFFAFKKKIIYKIIFLNKFIHYIN
jgi:hypothetical protein